MSRRSQRAEKKRQKWGQIAIGLLLVFLMVVSIVSINPDTNNTFKFNDIKFDVQQDFFVAKINGEQGTYRYAPYEGNTTRALLQTPYGGVVEFNSEPAISRYLAVAPYIAITFDPEMQPEILPIIDGIRYELMQELGYIFEGVLTNSTAYASLPVLDCPEATSEIPVIKLLLANTTGYGGFANLTLEGSCITVLADAPGLAATRDYILFARQGVLPDE
ncbi:hypothetical protein GOV07_03995 [Candidatus Woesearchaeota archaeon]|nr:hypothetical protein [Candidatus Woesearchaeota archaeon]